jgi:hypothetical protein
VAIIQSNYDYPLTQQANRWVLDKILNVDKVVVQTWLDYNTYNSYKIGYACIRKDKVVLKMVFDDDTPLQDRVTAMQVALRMNDGNDSQGQEGGTS